MNASHTPVLVDEVVGLLDPQDGDIILDGTVGAGGHAAALLIRGGPSSTLIGIDRDNAALALAAETLRPFGERAHLLQGSYADAAELLATVIPNGRVNRILLDLGVSSMELESSGRGFSFQHTDEPLDMRFDPSQRITATDILARTDETELTRIFREYGEDPLSHKIAREIVRRRMDHPVTTVSDLVSCVLHVYGNRAKTSRMHPATRTFQALRVAVNDELGMLTNALPTLLDLLAPGGRIAVISFHSLEDRIVKQFFKRESTDCVCPPKLPTCVCGHMASLRILTKHVVRAQESEQQLNPRSRSAKLRVAEKKTENKAEEK